MATLEENIYKVALLIERPCPVEDGRYCESYDHVSKQKRNSQEVHRFLREGFITGTHLKNATEKHCDEWKESLVDVIESKKIGKVGL